MCICIYGYSVPKLEGLNPTIIDPVFHACLYIHKKCSKVYYHNYALTSVNESTAGGDAKAIYNIKLLYIHTLHYNIMMNINFIYALISG